MRHIVIEPAVAGKGRSFEAICLATVQADGLWSGGGTVTDVLRPVWAVFAGSEAEMRPFMANLKLGRKGTFVTTKKGYSRDKTERLELLRSVGYQVLMQREAEGVIATVYLPELFLLDPGMVDMSGINFVLLPPATWAEKQVIDAAPILRYAGQLQYAAPPEALPSLVPLSYLFAAYLDRRTRCPLLSDGRFYLQLLLAALHEGFASWSGADPHSFREKPWGKHLRHEFTEEGTASVGMMPGIAFSGSHTQVEDLLARQVEIFFQHTRGK